MTSTVFLYKYVVVDNSDHVIKWETGYNRICNLDYAKLQGLYTQNEFFFKDVSVVQIFQIQNFSAFISFLKMETSPNFPIHDKFNKILLNQKFINKFF